jgi:hypothetical protein
MGDQYFQSGREPRRFQGPVGEKRRRRLVGRVHFNLAENRRDQDYPFAFMATYTSGLSADGVLRHLPLGQALREDASAGDKAKLLQLLAPVQQASEACA